MSVLLLDSQVGPVEQMPIEEYLEAKVRLEIQRWYNADDWLASLPAEEFERRARTIGREQLESIQAVRKYAGVYDRSFLTTRAGRKSFHDGFALFKGAELMWRLSRGDTSGTGTLTPIGATTPAATDTENTLTYNNGANAKTFLDIGTNSTALADPGDRSRNTVRTLDANATARQACDSGFWVIKTISNTPVLNSSIAQAKWTFSNGAMPSGAGNLMNWNEFLLVNNATRTTPWNDFNNTAVDLFVSVQGTKRSEQVWAVTIEYTLA